MTTKNDGGPAFPTHVALRDDDGKPWFDAEHYGMTLRDWFAGQAGARIISEFSMHQFDDALHQDAAKAAYAFADAMIAERSK